MTNSMVTLKCSRVGTVVLNEFIIKLSSGEVFTYWTKATDVSLDKSLNVALSSEYARYSIYSIKVTNN